MNTYSLSSYLHYFGTILNIFVSACITLIISNELGRSVYTEYSAYMSYSIGCVVLGSLGVPSYLQTYLPRANRLFGTLILHGILVRLSISLSLCGLVLVFIHLQGLLLLGLVLSGVLVSVVLDMALIAKGHLSLIFYLKLLSNFLKLFFVFYLANNLEITIQYFILIDVLIVLVSWLLSSFSISLHRAIRLNQLYTFYPRFYQGHVSNSLSFLSTPYFFIIVLTIFIDPDSSSMIGGFAFVSSMGYFVFSSISLSGRFEQVMVTNFLKGSIVDIASVIRLSSLLCVAVGAAVSVHSSYINEFLLKDQYADTIKYIPFIVLSALFNGMSYAYSPQIYKSARLKALTIASSVGVICSLTTIALSIFIFQTQYFFLVLFLGGCMINLSKVVTLAILMRDKCHYLNQKNWHILIESLIFYALSYFSGYLLLYAFTLSNPYEVAASILGTFLFSCIAFYTVRKFEYRFRFLGI